jgi:hypothetical protein
MKVGFFLVLGADVSHFLHASALVRNVKKYMPRVEVVQLSDLKTPMVPGVTKVERQDGANRPLLDQRLDLYSQCAGDWLLIDSDCEIRNSVQGVFDDKAFDIALCDRNWPHHPQGEAMMHAMPFNTGVIFSRKQGFWFQVYKIWKQLPEKEKDWLSEQRTVYQVIRSGRFKVKILPGMHYNYPPNTPEDAPIIATILHFKGNRKPWLSDKAVKTLST